MSQNPEKNTLPASQQRARLIHRLIEASSELLAYRSAQTIPPHSQNTNSDVLQEVASRLQEAVDALAHIDSTLKEGRDSSFSGDAPNLERGEQAQDSPSTDYLQSLQKRAEQTPIQPVTNIEALSKEEIQRAFYELEVHQVELKMQNEELLRMQMELETSRDRFSKLFDLAPVGYCILDRKGRVIEANTTLCQLLCVPASELVQTPIQHYIQEEDQDAFYRYQKAMRKNITGPIAEIQMVKKGGERFFAQLESRVGQEPEDQHWLVVSDISSLKRAEEITAQHAALAAAHAELEIEKNRYQDLFDFAPDGYLVTDETGTILDINQAGAALLCSTKAPLVGAPLVDFIFEGERANFQCHLDVILEAHAAGSSPRYGEWETCLNPEGREPFPTAVTAILLREKPNSPVQIRWLFRDVSARKQTEAELVKSMARFRALFEESSMGIRLLDLQGNTITSNGAVQETLGYAEGEMRQIPFTQLTHPFNLTEDEAYFRSLVSGEIDRYTIEKRCIRKDGTFVWVHQVMFLVRDAADAPSFLVAMTENISERKQMESELTEVRRLLIDMPEAERLMLSQELHDGPMQDLYGVFYNMKSLEGKLTGEDEQIISSSANTINQVVNVLRGFAGQLRPPTLKSSGLAKTIQSHAEQFQEDHPEITISLNLMTDGQRLPERVSLALFRIYQQSLANILRHAHATRIDIRLILDERHLQLGIEDNGKGFEVPTRLVDMVRNGHYGLVGAAERAEAIGGTLTIDSHPGGGTTIFVNVNLVS